MFICIWVYFMNNVWLINISLWDIDDVMLGFEIQSGFIKPSKTQGDVE